MAVKLFSAVQTWWKNTFGKRTTEAVTPFLFGLTAADSEDAKFRRITSPQTIRDLNPMMHERMQAVAFYLSATTPFGKRIVEVITDYVVAEGFKPIATDESVQEVIDRFWGDPVNNMEETPEAWCDELTRFGELCVPVTVNPVDGFVRIGYIDPLMIESVEYGVLDAGDGQQQPIMIPIAVHLKRKMTDTVGKVLQIIRVDEDPNSATFGQLKGDCFYFAINKAKGASRGLSELFSLADWIDVFDQMMFDFADKVRFLNAFVWQYVAKGADQPTVDKLKKDFTQNPPRQGSVLVTNEQVEMKQIAASMGGADMSEGARLVKMYGLGGAGLPAWFFADPMDSNRNTADEMTGPTGKKLTRRQNGVKRNIVAVLTFVVQQAIYRGVLPEQVDTTLSLQVPDLMIKDLQKAAMTLGAVTNSASIAEQNHWITGETAARIFHTVVSQIGIDIDSKDEYAKAQEEKKQQELNLVPDQSNLAAALQQLEGGAQPGAAAAQGSVQ